MQLLAYASDYNGNLIYAKCLDTAQYGAASAVRIQAIITVIIHINTAVTGRSPLPSEPQFR